MTIPFEVTMVLLTASLGVVITGIYKLLTITREVENFQEWKVEHIKMAEAIIHRLEDISMRVLRMETWIAADERNTTRDMELIREIKKEIEQFRHQRPERRYPGS